MDRDQFVEKVPVSFGLVSIGFASLVAFSACSDHEPFGATSAELLVVGQSDIHVVGTSNALARIEDLMPAADGAAWALNNTEPFLVLLSAGGEELRTFGQSGGGPGEFSWPSTLVQDPRTEVVWAFEASLGRLVRVPDETTTTATLSLAGSASTGARLNSYDYLWMNNGGRAWIQGTADGFVYARPSPELGWIYSLWSTDVVRLRANGTVEQILSTADVVGDPSARFGEATRFLPYPIWTACPDGSLTVYDPNQNALRRFSATGDPVAVHQLPPERRVRVSAERIFTTVYPGVLRNRLMADPPERDVLHEMVRRDYENRATEFAAVFPEYVHLDCSGQRTLWLQAFDTTRGQMGRGPSWLRVTAAGAMGPVQFPVSFRPMRFSDGRVWGVHTGDLDVEYIAWAAVSEP